MHVTTTTTNTPQTLTLTPHSLNQETMKAELTGIPTPTPIPDLLKPTQPPLSGALKGCLSTLDFSCIEKLLLHCGSALESNDVTLAQQIMWVLNNVASSQGDPNQRISSWFLRALISRASRVCPTAMNLQGTLQRTSTRLMTVTELAGYVDLIPWYRFGFSSSNGAIFNAIQGYPKVHILDFSITHCMQWPTLIDGLSKVPQGAPLVRLSVPFTRPQVPPFLNISLEEVGLRLSNFAKSREVPFEFRVIPIDGCSKFDESYHDLLLGQLSPSLLDLRSDEALVINCQNSIRYLPDEPTSAVPHNTSTRDGFLEIIRGFNPCIVTVVDEDSNVDYVSLSSRISACFNYLWIPFDALETFLAKDSWQRLEFEGDIGHKIENIVGFEGLQRIERLECGSKLVQRMRRAHFESVSFCEETVREVKFVLDEHASGWGMKREDDMLVLTWKGHNAVFSTAWVPQQVP